MLQVRDSEHKSSSGGRAKVLGTVVCLGGAILMTFYRGMPLFSSSQPQGAIQTVDQALIFSLAKRKERWTIGSIALIAGTLLWSSWFLLLQSNIARSYPCQCSSTAIMAFFGAIQSAILSFCIDRNLALWVLKGKTEILSLLYAVRNGRIRVVYCGDGVVCQETGSRLHSSIQPLVQIMAAMFEVPILHEEIHLGSLLGSIVVIVGLYALLWGKNKEMPKCEPNVAHQTEEIKDQEPQFQVVEISCDSRPP
ncbi:unnamed protein product [Ilex paraguariensis]|uniref:WAT1-related protein n=1 Tax=Ilex paraguariensis TaxID=185542 RepID=A0ABC8TF45_9AQUA